MKERPILMHARSINGILEERKTQTRRIIKPQPDYVYGLTADSLRCYYNRHEDNNWNTTQTDSGFAKRRLYGRGGRKDLFENVLQRLWEKGVRGLVSVKRTPDKERLFECFFMSREQEGDEISASTDLYRLPRDASGKQQSGQTHERKSGRLCADESEVGNTGRQLDRSEDSRQTLDQFHVQTDAGRTPTSEMGASKRTMQPKTRGAYSWNESSIHLRNSPFEIGRNLWVRETWGIFSTDGGTVSVGFKQRLPEGKTISDTDGGLNVLNVDPEIVRWAESRISDGKWRPSIFMPRWASRLTLEITGIRVERVQDISEKDCYAEGCNDEGHPYISSFGGRAVKNHFAELWDDTNGAGAWERNEWCWVLDFKRIIQ